MKLSKIIDSIAGLRYKMFGGSDTRINASQLPYRTVIFNVTDSDEDGFSFEKLIDTSLEQDIIIEKNENPGTFLFLRSSGLPFVFTVDQLKKYCFLSPNESFFMNGGSQDVVFTFGTDKNDWTAQYITFYSVYGFGLGTDFVAKNSIVGLTFFDIIGENANIGVKTI